jgi:hypothetical protein
LKGVSGVITVIHPSPLRSPSVLPQGLERPPRDADRP